MTYSLLTIVIQKQIYKYEDIQSKLDTLFILDRIAHDQYVELVDMVNEIYYSIEPDLVIQ